VGWVVGWESAGRGLGWVVGWESAGRGLGWVVGWESAGRGLGDGAGSGVGNKLRASIPRRCTYLGPWALGISLEIWLQVFLMNEVPL
jgi:hypothetical protein